MPRKKALETHLWKKTMLQKWIFYVFLWWKLANYKCFSRTKLFMSGWKEKIDLVTSNNPNGESHEKIFPEMRRSTIETGKFYIKLVMSICTRKTLLIHARSFFGVTSLSLISFFFYHRHETKAMNFTKHRRETSLLHTLSHKCLKSYDFILLL